MRSNDICNPAVTQAWLTLLIQTPIETPGLTNVSSATKPVSVGRNSAHVVTSVLHSSVDHKVRDCGFVLFVVFFEPRHALTSWDAVLSLAYSFSQLFFWRGTVGVTGQQDLSDCSEGWQRWTKNPRHVNPWSQYSAIFRNSLCLRYNENILCLWMLWPMKTDEWRTSFCSELSTYGWERPQSVCGWVLGLQSCLYFFQVFNLFSSLQSPESSCARHHLLQARSASRLARAQDYQADVLDDPAPSNWL